MEIGELQQHLESNNEQISRMEAQLLGLKSTDEARAAEMDALGKKFEAPVYSWRNQGLKIQVVQCKSNFFPAQKICFLLQNTLCWSIIWNRELSLLEIT